MMGIIYEIICWTTGLRYIGKTKQTLNKRLSQHKSAKGKLECSSKLVVEHGNYEMYEVEKVDESRLIEREKYYIQHTDCVNSRPIIDDRKEYHAEYNKQVVMCECGKMITIAHLARHRKTKVHQNFLAL